MKAAEADTSAAPPPPPPPPPPPAPVKESVQPSETGHDGKDLDNSAIPLAVTTPSAKVNETTPAPAPIASEPAPAPTPTMPDTISLPAQIAREQIVSGQVIEPLPEQRERSKGQRVVGAAREVVGEKLAPRVEKLRQASNVVWGEAQDDPNLRFILVAVFLFILAIVIILLGTYVR